MLIQDLVNRIQDFNGRTLLFDRVIYRPATGFPNENELVVNTTNAVGCCVVCQTTASAYLVYWSRAGICGANILLAQLRWVFLRTQ